ncbi:hypothetical protein SAMN05518856_11753 [Paenibacillus sp. OK003]|nr:hypothetical protein SAMN05518856_11753 [Paenibacillus sp. OK003]
MRQENEFRILILGDKVSLQEVDIEKYDHVVLYDQVMNELFDITQKLYHANYDYNFFVECY